MAATLTGTPVAVNWAAGANPAGQSVTIPSDATAVYMFWSYDGLDANGHGLASATLNGASPSQTFEIPTAAGFYPATGVAAWYNPATGSQTLDPAWDAAPVEGPTTIVAFVKGGDTSSWRDADADQDIDTNAVSVTLTTVSGDLVIKFDQRFDGSENPPTLSSGWTNGATGGNVDEGCRLSYISATGTTQVCASENESYSSIVAISIPADAGPSITAGLGALTITGFAPTVSATGGGNVSISSALGQAVITGLAPTIASSNNISIAPALGQAVITGFAPDQTLTLASPPPGILVLAGHAPTAQVSVNVSIAPALGQAVITGLAPTLSTTDNRFAAPGVAEAVITGYAPTLSQAGSFSASPGVGILELIGLQPSVVNSGDPVATRRRAGGGWGQRRQNYIYKGKKYLNYTNEELCALIRKDMIDITREDIRVTYKGKKPHPVSRNAWAELQETMKRLSEAIPETADTDDEDIEAILSLL